MKSLPFRHALLAAVAISPCGCGILDTEAQRSYATDRLWNVPAAFTTADVRVITQRRHPVLNNEVLCTEPSPDVAKALTSSGSVAGSGGNGAVTGSISASASSAEALAELAGRSSALLVLRDSLYKACETYANGAIGQDAYALILSRYPQLMTTLFLAQDVTGAAAESKAALAAQPIPVATDKTADAQPSDSTGTRAGKARHAAFQPPLPGLGVMPALDLAGPYPWRAILRPAALETKVGTSRSSGKAEPAASTAAGAMTGSRSDLALTRMAEDYMHQNILNVIVVACINQYDPTRLSNAGPNPFLAKLCAQVDFPTLEKIARADPPWKPVDPTNPQRR